MRLIDRLRASLAFNTILEDRDLDGYAFDLFVTEREQLPLAVGERLCDVAGYHAGYIMGFCRFFHSCRDVDRTAVDPDRPLGVALLADDDLAAVHPDAEARHNAELTLIFRPLPRDRREHRVNRPQDPVSTDRLIPVPQSNQTVALIEIDLSAIVGNRLGEMSKRNLPTRDLI